MAMTRLECTTRSRRSPTRGAAFWWPYVSTRRGAYAVSTVSPCRGATPISSLKSPSTFSASTPPHPSFVRGHVPLVIHSEPRRSGVAYGETLSQTLPIGLKRLPVYPADGVGRRGRNGGGDCHAVLPKGRRSHSLRGGRHRLPAVGHPRRRPQFAGQQLADRGYQRDGRVQERLSLHHDGPTQCEWRRVDGSGACRQCVGCLCRRPARADGPSRRPRILLHGLLHWRLFRREAAAASA